MALLAISMKLLWPARPAAADNYFIYMCMDRAGSCKNYAHLNIITCGLHCRALFAWFARRCWLLWQLGVGGGLGLAMPWSLVSRHEMPSFWELCHTTNEQQTRMAPKKLLHNTHLKQTNTQAEIRTNTHAHISTHNTCIVK